MQSRTYRIKRNVFALLFLFPFSYQLPIYENSLSAYFKDNSIYAREENLKNSMTTENLLLCRGNVFLAIQPQRAKCIFLRFILSGPLSWYQSCRGRHSAHRAEDTIEQSPSSIKSSDRLLWRCDWPRKFQFQVNSNPFVIGKIKRKSNWIWIWIWIWIRIWIWRRK